MQVILEVFIMRPGYRKMTGRPSRIRPMKAEKQKTEDLSKAQIFGIEVVSAPSAPSQLPWPVSGRRSELLPVAHVGFQSRITGKRRPDAPTERAGGRGSWSVGSRSTAHGSGCVSVTGFSQLELGDQLVQ